MEYEKCSDNCESTASVVNSLGHSLNYTRATELLKSGRSQCLRAERFAWRDCLHCALGHMMRCHCVSKTSKNFDVRRD